MSSDNIDLSQNRKNLKRKANQSNLDSNMNFEDEIINIKQSMDKMRKKINNLENMNKKLKKTNVMLEDAVNDVLDRLEEYDIEYYEDYDKNYSNNYNDDNIIEQFTFDISSMKDIDNLYNIISSKMSGLNNSLVI